MAVTWNPDPILRTLTAEQLLAVLLFGEARGETLDGQIAVANVVRNRVYTTAANKRQSPSDLWMSIMLKPWAFSCFDNDGGNWNARKVVAFAQGLVQAHTHAQPVAQPVRQLLWIASGALADALPDLSRGATHYFVRNSPVPKWASGRTPLQSLDSHDFYRLSDTSYL